MPLEPRRLEPGDDRAVVALAEAAFADSDRRLGRRAERRAAADSRAAELRVRHLVGTDPGGAWGVEADGALVGAMLAILREGLWGLSLLVVRPGAQGTGVGDRLLRQGLEYGDGARGGLILSSDDPRAMRVYHRAGFRVRPCLAAEGRPVLRGPAPAGVRPLEWPGDRAIVDAAGRAVRGAGHGTDFGTFLEQGARAHVHEAGGFVVHRGGEVKLLAAHEDCAAADLLRAALGDMQPDRPARLTAISEGQDWAVAVALEAGLDLRPGGPVFARGDVGPLRPYLPSGAYL